MVKACDLYIANDVYSGNYVGFDNCHYFPFDVADGELVQHNLDKKYDVVFFGSYLGQGERVEWITEINKTHPVRIYSWNHEEWKKMGIDAHPAVYGDEFSKIVARSKIILQFSVSDHCWGYWSNRVGKVLTLGGFLLARYAPGMELFLRNGAEYFSSVKEANEKISYYLINEIEREIIAEMGRRLGRSRFTSKQRIADLVILIERYLQGG